MLVLSMQTDYAILALGHLWRASSDRLVTAREISARYGIPPELMAKILQRLAREGLVRATPGAAGGYALLARLDETSVADVLRVIEGPLHIVRCTGDTCCNIAASCDIIEPMRMVQDRVVATLEQIRVSELVCQEVAAS
ncbi:MAG: Rrf2 family transcriptional regulator [Proteobacteria bacterium]|nr:Rrf2 family transcriptional regulator [Pseudomonadota bacterium]